MRHLLRRFLGGWLLVELSRAVITGIYKQRKRNREREMPVTPEL